MVWTLYVSMQSYAAVGEAKKLPVVLLAVEVTSTKEKMEPRAATRARKMYPLKLLLSVQSANQLPSDSIAVAAAKPAIGTGGVCIL